MPYTITITGQDGTSTTTRFNDDAALRAHVRAACLPMSIATDLPRRDTTIRAVLRDGRIVTAKQVTALDAVCDDCGVTVGVPCQGPSGRTRRHGPHPARFTAAGLDPN